MNYKNIQYTNVFMGYPEVEEVAKKVGAQPTSKKVDGSPYYTIPFVTIEHLGSSKPIVLSDSPAIALYLDNLYPEPSRAIDPDTLVFEATFREFLTETWRKLAPITMRDFIAALPENDKQWVLDTRKQFVGIRFEDILPPLDNVEEMTKTWAMFDDAFNALAKRLDAGGEGNYQVVKGKVTYSEIEMVSLIWFLYYYSEKSCWERVKGMNGGRWEKLLDAYSEWLPKPVA